jgi:hypothetical protein
MNQHDFYKYKKKQVAIGTPHWKDSNKLFYYYGIITSVDEDGIIITKGGEDVFVTYDRIKEFRASGMAHATN